MAGADNIFVKKQQERDRAAGKKPKPYFSPEARQRLSEAAKRRHQEGTLGGPVYGALGGRGNTRKKRLASQSIAEAAQENANALIEVLKAGIHPDAPLKQRVATVKVWTDIEKDHKRIEQAEIRDEGQKLDRGQLLALLRQRMQGGPAANLIRRTIEEGGIVDAEIIEVADEDD